MFKKRLHVYGVALACMAGSVCYGMSAETVDLPESMQGISETVGFPEGTEVMMAEIQKIEEPVKKGPMMTMHTMVDIGIDAEKRMKVADMLHNLLSNEYVLYAKTQKFHWNVKGPFFGPLHKLFNEQYDKLAEFIDEIAERSLSLGVPSIGTLKEFLNRTTLQEEPGVNPSYEMMIAQLLADHETVIKQVRAGVDATQEVGDMGTNNFLADLLEKHEKMAWMLRAHLQK